MHFRLVSIFVPLNVYILKKNALVDADKPKEDVNS